MKPITDGLGNELHEGDMVWINKDAVVMFVGTIAKMQDGGIIGVSEIAPKGIEMPAKVVIVCELTLAGPPGGVIPHLAKVYTPKKKEP